MNRVPSDSETYATRSNELLIDDLASSDLTMVSQVRQVLVKRGNAVVPDLLKALRNSNGYLQWEAARVLEESRDPSAAPVLVDALTDENFVVRWVASKALATLQEAGLPPLLHALIRQSDCIWLRRGAHQVLRDLSHGKLEPVTRPVLQALEGVEPNLSVPIAASHALSELAKRLRKRRK